MRILALIFGLLGTAGSGLIGVRWMNDVGGKEAEMKLAYELTRDLPNNQLKTDAEEAYRRSKSYYGLLGGAALGAIACFLVGMRKGVLAGALFLAAFAIPMAMYQRGILAVFTGALVVAGLLSFFVKSGVPYKPARPRPGISEDDDLVG